LTESPIVKSRLVLFACCLTLVACGHMPRLWPFAKKAKPGPQAVSELNLVNADGSAATFPQYWLRNTLVIDLSGASGSGNVAARLPPGTTWPVRMAVRVRPGGVQQVEILGEERNVLPVTTAGTKAIDLELAPTVYTPRTAAIYISWGPIPMFVEAAPAPEPVFVSPTVVPQTAPGETPAAPVDVEAPASPSASEIIPPGSTGTPQPPPGS
jgi:hypothetical protein